MASVFSGTSVLVVMALGLFGLLVGRKLHSRGTSDPKVTKEQETELVDSEFEDAVPTNFNGEQTGLVRTTGASPTGFARERKSVVRLPVTVPSSLYGAYRIDQEVNKLILGQPHRMDVLSSRAPDDMRAIETSLIKTIASQENDESAQRRAREALEEYGFVARQCASLLLAPDAFERTSAARSLGEVKSPAALPFLLEGLYDHESIVRNQAVISIGELRVPAAIGALLDMARRHPDVPSSLVSRALSACSVEGIDFFDAMVPEPALLSAGYGSNLMHEITHLEPATHVEDLPKSSTDELLAAALVKSESSELEERTQSVKDLAQFQVQEAVLALSRIARCDVEPNVRAHAIASLASINHESVFPAILLGMADESREVRAAAARSLSRLSFDRADAYVRVLETADDELLADVARACLQAGIVGQNIDRLASNDRRQAYEAFAVICLLAKAQMTDSVLEAISSHANAEVRMMAIHLLATTGHPQVFEQFRQLAVQNGISEDVKTALLEAMYKMEQTKSKADEAPEVFWVSNEAEHGQRSDINVADEIVAGADPFESPAPDLATNFEEGDLRSSGLQAPGIA
jgi:HEAT repeat protein